MRFWTLFALALARILGRGPTELVAAEGREVEVIPIHRLIPSWAWAQTWGEVVLVREDKLNSEDLYWLLPHEAVHLRQWRRWGFWFPFVYAWGSLKAALQGKHYYWDNPFEVEAYREGRRD